MPELNNLKSNYIIISSILLIIVTLIIIILIYYYKKKSKKININLIKKILFKDIVYKDTICSICIGNLDSNKLVKINCNHVFHKKCLTEWNNHNIQNQNNISCPLCTNVYYVLDV